MKRTVLRNILGGKFTRTQLRFYILVSLILFSGLLFISYILYPQDLHYSVLTHTISYLGDYTQNPRGWLVFSISFAFIGLSFIPLTLYLHQRVKLIENFWGILGTGFLVGGNVGVVLIGFVPDVHGADFFNDISLGKAHVLVSLITLILFALGLTIYGILFLLNGFPSLHRGKIDLYPEAHTRYVFITFAVIGIGTLITQRIAIVRNYTWPYPGIYSFSLWEWMLSLTIFACIYWLSWTLPNKLPSQNEGR